MFSEIIISILLCAGVFILVLFVSRIITVPRKGGERVVTVLSSKGTAATIEHTVKALIKARDLYGIKMEIILPENGLEGERGTIAKLLERDYDEIHIHSADEISMILKNI